MIHQITLFMGLHTETEAESLGSQRMQITAFLISSDWGFRFCALLTATLTMRSHQS